MTVSHCLEIAAIGRAHCVSTQKVTVAAGAVGVTGVGAQEPAMLFLHVAGSCETPGE